MKRLLFIPVVITIFVLLQSCKSTDKLSKSSSIEQAMVQALEWQEAHPISALAPTDWTNGAYYTGVARAHKATKNKKFLNALEAMGKRNNWQTYKRHYHADDVAISYSYLYLYKLKPNMVNLKPTADFIHDHLYKNYEWKKGTDKVKKILWWWCDALFMAPPVLTVYADIEDDRRYLDEMNKYYKQTYNLLYDHKEHLFARDARYLWKGNGKGRKEENGKKIFWSRGNGWVLGGLALILNNMPKDYKHRAFYVTLFKQMAAKIKKIQPKDGLWTTSLLNPDSYDHGEVSGSGFYTFALAWGINYGILDATEYTPAVTKAWKALRAYQHPNGKVGWVQNIGAEPKPASYDSWQNYGTGAFLLAGSEMLKLK